MTKALVAEDSFLPNIGSLSEPDRNAIVKNSFIRTSRFERQFGSHAVNLDCHGLSEILKSEIVRLLIAKGIDVPQGKIETLHHHISQELKDYNFDDGVNKLSTFLYDSDATFIETYHRFIKDCVAAYFPYPFYFQATPTIRIQCPGGKNSDHYPRYHTDIGYGHPPEEINIWIPLTAPLMPQYHGFRLMNVKDSLNLITKFDFEFAPFIDRVINDKPFNHSLDAFSPSVTTDFGNMFAFDSRCVHTGEALQQHTRASIDIRIMPVEDFDKLAVEYQGSGRRKMRYVPGQAYYHLSSDAL